MWIFIRLLSWAWQVAQLSVAAAAPANLAYVADKTDEYDCLKQIFSRSIL